MNSGLKAREQRETSSIIPWALGHKMVGVGRVGCGWAAAPVDNAVAGEVPTPLQTRKLVSKTITSITHLDCDKGPESITYDASSSGRSKSIHDTCYLVCFAARSSISLCMDSSCHVTKQNIAVQGTPPRPVKPAHCHQCGRQSGLNWKRPSRPLEARMLLKKKCAFCSPVPGRQTISGSHPELIISSSMSMAIRTQVMLYPFSFCHRRIAPPPICRSMPISLLHRLHLRHL